jgi:hypothetical protein
MPQRPRLPQPPIAQTFGHLPPQTQPAAEQGGTRPIQVALP